MSYERLMREQLPERVYQLLKRIGNTGDEMGLSVFAAGGFVRDLLIGSSNLDIDVVVEGDGIAFAHAFAKNERGQVRRHRRFGTAVVVLPDGFKVDVATARTETYAHPGALPSVNPASIREDLLRRDFTINAMAMALNEDRFGELVDFFDGKADILSGSVKALHDLSFVDDPTRIFRAVRFEQRYGFSIEPHTAELLQRAVSEDCLKTISGQRLRNEILLMLKEEYPFPAIRRLADFDLVKYIHPRICVSDELAELFDRIRDMRGNMALVNLMALLDQLSADEAVDVSERLALRKRHTEALSLCKIRLSDILQRLDGINLQPSEVYRILKGLPVEVLHFGMAKCQGASDNILLYLTRLRKVRPLVNGNDLRRLGYSEGPLYTQILNETFAAQLDGLKGKSRAIQFITERFSL